MSKHDHPWRDEGLLREKYHGEGLTQKEIADEFGCSYETISRWMNRLGVESRGGRKPDGIHRDKDFLKRYHTEKLTIKELAEEAGVTRSTIRHWMDNHDIESRGRDYSLWRPASYVHDERGYRYWYSGRGGVKDKVAVHQLLAIAMGYDPHWIFSGEAETHHKNGIKWDNRPDNIVVLSRDEHQEIHKDDYVSPWEND